MIYLELFLTFFLIGAFTFGGGYAMLPLIQEQVAAHGWMEAAQITDFIAVSESTPGPFAINISTYVGMEMGGLLGAACATLGVVLPSFIVILIVAKCYAAFQNSRIVSGCMTGLRPVVVGLIGSAVLTMAGDAFFPAGASFEAVMTMAFIVAAVIFVIMLILAFKKVSPVIIILLSAALGIAGGYAQAYFYG